MDEVTNASKDFATFVEIEYKTKLDNCRVLGLYNNGYHLKFADDSCNETLKNMKHLTTSSQDNNIYLFTHSAKPQRTTER